MFIQQMLGHKSLKTTLIYLYMTSKSLMGINLNAPYFHVVFTMQEQLHMVIYHNQKLLYGLMYKAVAETLSELSQDPKYLGHKLVFSLFSIHGGKIGKDTITIRAKDYRNKSKKTTVTVKAVEFIRRFLMHILPKGLVKIRHYGLIANPNKKTKLKLCKKLTKSPTYKPEFDG